MHRSICIYDAFYEEPAVLGTRATGNGGGRWLLVGPGYQEGSVAGFPADQVLRTSTVHGFLLGRISEFRGAGRGTGGCAALCTPLRLQPAPEVLAAPRGGAAA